VVYVLHRVRGTLRPRALALAFLCALVLVIGACSSIGLKRELISRDADNTLVEKVTGFSAPDKAPVSRQIAPEDVTSSLKRILVRYHGVVSFSKSDPVPLLTNEQADAFAAILSRELPSLAGNQRIRFSFKDARKRNLNELDVYVDGAYLVYYFNMLVGNPKLAMNVGDPPFSEATIWELPGQDISQAVPAAVILKDPIPNTREARAADLAGALAQIEEQRTAGAIPAEEATRLKALAEQHPQVRAATWRTYWEKRTTLRKAKDQGLFDESGYKAQLAKIEAELAP
jgi:hypothetical protein